MRSVERRFKQVQDSHPEWLSITCFFEAVQCQNFNTMIISRWFNKLVDEDNYSKSDKKFIIRQLQLTTKPCEECQKQSKSASKKSKLKGGRYE